MTLHYPTFRTCALLLLFITALGLSSCDDDAEKGKDFTVTIEATQRQVGYFYFLSDEEGKTIASHLVTTPGNVELKPSTPYQYDTYSFTEIFLLDRQVTTTWSATTYAGLEAKSLSWKFSAGATDFSNVNFNFLGLSGPQEVANVSTDYQSRQVFNNAENQMMPGYGNTKLLAVVQDIFSGSLKYRLFDNNGNGFAGGNTTPYPIDFSLVTEALSTKTISAPPPGVTPSAILVNGIKNSGASPEYYRFGQYSHANQLTMPDPGSTFDGYLYTTSFRLNNHSHSVANTSTPSFEGLQFGITGASAQAGTLTFTTTGAYDYGMAKFYTPNWSHYWEVYVPSSMDTRTITLPELPADRPEKIDSAPLEQLNFNYFFARDLKEIEGYDDYIQNRSSISSWQESRGVTVNAADIGG